MKTIAEINEKIRAGEAVVVRADEMPEIVEKHGAKKAAEEVDVVTTGTFGAMCSSGAFLNFGHADPPIKFGGGSVYLNEVPAYAGLAAVDVYIGSTALSINRGLEYGGAHVIEDLVAGKEIDVRATAYGTDCYPRKKIETSVTLDDLNQAYLFNPRNNYQRYNAATNTTDRTVYTYMGTLLPNSRNVNFSGTGELSPLNNDPNYETIGFGTRIFLCGAQGYIVGEGTQHSPKNAFGNIAVKGNLQDMDKKFIKGATVHQYGTTLFVGIGIPIPVLNEKIARNTAVRNKDIKTNILDYGVPRLNRPVVREVTYEELFSGRVELNGKSVKTGCLSSLKTAREIADELGKWIEAKEFFITEPLEPLPRDTVFKPMRIKEKVPFVSEIMTKPVITAKPKETIGHVSNLIVKNQIDQVPIVDDENRVVGIVTSWDITNATAKHKKKLAEIMTARVITSRVTEPLDVVARRIDKHQINSTPVVDDQNRIVGIVTLSDVNKYYQRRR